jgi:hypothetical protein
MTVRKFPVHSFPWYVQDWANSKSRLQFDLPERMLYCELLFFCTAEGGFPEDEKVIAKIGSCTVDQVRDLWPKIRHKFYKKPNSGGLLSNKKASNVRTAIQIRKMNTSDALVRNRLKKKVVRENVNQSLTRGQLEVNLNEKACTSPSPSPSSIRASPSPSLHSSNNEEMQRKPPYPPLPNGFDFESWVVARIRTHPNKKWPHQAIALLASKPWIEDPAERQQFEGDHEYWCHTSLWTWEQGANCPTFSEFVHDYELSYKGQKAPEAKKTERSKSKLEQIMEEIH